MGDQEVESSIENDDEHIDAMLKRIEVHGHRQRRSPSTTTATWPRFRRARPPLR
jgi:hypothetical protein